MYLPVLTIVFNTSFSKNISKPDEDCDLVSEDAVK